jgi:putative heme utilization carrier protein HutX
MARTGTEAIAAGRPPLAERLRTNADGILEQIARDYGVSTFAVLEALPAEHRAIVPGALFEEVMRDLAEWGETLFLVHTPDIVLECAGKVPPGSFGRGYFNIHGDSPLSGHIKADACTHIAFVSRPFMGRPSRSLQFFNGGGEPMFKVFVRRDPDRNLIGDQVARFDALRRRLAEGD